jgi:hypothetical protein
MVQWITCRKIRTASTTTVMSALSLWRVMLTLSIIGITSFSNSRGAEIWRFNGVISMEIRVPLREWWLTCPAGGILILTPTYISYLLLHLLIIPSFTCMYCPFFVFYGRCLDVTRIRYDLGDEEIMAVERGGIETFR